jgi:hypothetical protein
VGRVPAQCRVGLESDVVRVRRRSRHVVTRESAAASAVAVPHVPELAGYDVTDTTAFAASAMFLLAHVRDDLSVD